MLQKLQSLFTNFDCKTFCFVKVTLFIMCSLAELGIKKVASM